MSISNIAHDDAQNTVKFSGKLARHALKEVNKSECRRAVSAAVAERINH